MKNIDEFMQFKKEQESDPLFKVTSVGCIHGSPERLEMRGSLPLKIKLIDLFDILGLDEFRNILKSLSELEYSLLENGHFPGRPAFEHIGVCQRIYQNI